MWICINLRGRRFCFWIPIYYQIPVFPPHPDPEHYVGLITDATILATVHEAAKHLTDETVRRSLESGVAASIKSMQAKAGEDFTISLEAPRK
jgi:hypothetical protein